ncbi:MAG TPA: trehalose-phosphatase [Desulfobacteria bacterium]|nr:trehalose-phosphatase [Desulfobacteria bacterium]
MKEEKTILPDALSHLDRIEREMEGKTPAVFLDYDGTLTPIVNSPDAAVLSPSMRRTVEGLAKRFMVAVISGRDLGDVRKRVGIPGIFYAGSHGFDIAGAEGRRKTFRQGAEFLPELDEAECRLREMLEKTEGVFLERKKFSMAIHYRNVPKEKTGDVKSAVDEVVSRFSGLRKSSGLKVYDLQPDIDWNKGKALLYVLEALSPDDPLILPIYIGDDTTDEDAFRTLRIRGIGIVVMDEARPTQARYVLKDPEAVQTFLESLRAMP